METASHTEPEPCPISRCAEIVCGKWTVLIIRDLADGAKYFRELELSLAGISPRTLCERLKFLTERGVISKTKIKALPPRTRYELTDKGRALEPLLRVMREYGAHLIADDEQAVVAAGSAVTAAAGSAVTAAAGPAVTAAAGSTSDPCD